MRPGTRRPLPHQGRALHRPARASPCTSPATGKLRPRRRWRGATTPTWARAHAGVTTYPTSSARGRLHAPAARGGPSRGPAAARRQRLRPGERAADDPVSGTPYAEVCSRTLPKSARSTPGEARRRTTANGRWGSSPWYQGLGGASTPTSCTVSATAHGGRTSASSRTPRSTRCWSRDAPPSVPRTVCRSTTRSRPSCSKSTIPRSTVELGPAGRRTPSLAEGLRPDQQQHRRHLSVYRSWFEGKPGV